MLEEINWKKVDGLLPTIIQSSVDQSVLMLGYMNLEALQITQESRIVHFYSRTKGRIWKKGESSGNILEVVSMHLDCDQDTLLITVIPNGYVCHEGFSNCFGTDSAPVTWLLRLEKIINDRMGGSDRGSYVKTLATTGRHRVAQKVAEEGIEVALASVQDDQVAIVEETADLLFHLMINLKIHNLDLLQIIACLQKRDTNRDRG